MVLREYSTPIDLSNLTVDDIIERYAKNDLVVLFRGARNDDSQANGNWWSEDAYYALGCSNDNNLFVTVLPRELMHQLQQDNELWNESDHEGNKWQFRQFSLPVRRLEDNEISAITAHAKVMPLGATRAIKTNLSYQSRINTSREAILD